MIHQGYDLALHNANDQRRTGVLGCATFGKTDSLPFFWRITRSRNNPEDYEDASFVEDVDENFVDFHYGGKKREILTTSPSTRADGLVTCCRD